MSETISVDPAEPLSLQPGHYCVNKYRAGVFVILTEAYTKCLYCNGSGHEPTNKPWSTLPCLHCFGEGRVHCPTGGSLAHAVILDSEGICHVAIAEDLLGVVDQFCGACEGVNPSDPGDYLCFQCRGISLPEIPHPLPRRWEILDKTLGVRTIAPW